jgi:hypothetical protein
MLFRNDTLKYEDNVFNLCYYLFGGIKEKNKNNLSQFYPNPFSDYTIWQNENYFSHAGVDIFDVNGRKIKSQIHSGANLRIDRDKLSPGIYFVTITDSQSTYWNNSAITKIQKFAKDEQIQTQCLIFCSFYAYNLTFVGSLLFPGHRFNGC